MYIKKKHSMFECPTVRTPYSRIWTCTLDNNYHANISARAHLNLCIWHNMYTSFMKMYPEWNDLYIEEWEGNAGRITWPFLRSKAQSGREALNVLLLKSHETAKCPHEAHWYQSSSQGGAFQCAWVKRALCRIYPSRKILLCMSFVRRHNRQKPHSKTAQGHRRWMFTRKIQELFFNMESRWKVKLPTAKIPFQSRHNSNRHNVQWNQAQDKTSCRPKPELRMLLENDILNCGSLNLSTGLGTKRKQHFSTVLDISKFPILIYINRLHHMKVWSNGKWFARMTRVLISSGWVSSHERWSKQMVHFVKCFSEVCQPVAFPLGGRSSQLMSFKWLCTKLCLGEGLLHLTRSFPLHFYNIRTTWSVK